MIPNAADDEQGHIVLPAAILSDQVVYPHMLTTLNVTSESGQAALQAALDEAQTLLVLAHDPRRTDQAIATEVAPRLVRDQDDHTATVLAQGRRRVAVVDVLQSLPYLRVRALPVANRIQNELRAQSLMNAALDLFQRMLEFDETITDAVADFIFAQEDPGTVADLVAAAAILPPADRQSLLNLLDVEERLNQLIRLLTQELNKLEVRDEINQTIQDEMNRGQREMILREQMRLIQNELGEGDVFQQSNNELVERLAQANLPDEVRAKAERELARLQMMSPITPEASVIRTYLEWLLDLPWQKASRDKLNLKQAEKVLERGHYGLKKVKDRILEHIAVRKLAGKKMKSPILCFVGPPGVGKTSLGRGIAEALGREFVRVSLGGVHDEAEIRGHRRTYIGAMPGRIVQTMKRAGTRNPVFMLDEIDKVGEDYRGDPSAALLEVLDPELNSEFADHYLEVPFDLSQVFFITTANDLYTVPEALEDRMEVIEFEGYTEEDKLEIARRFLIPKQLSANGIPRRGVRFQTDALQSIIREYTLEAGVRNLEREIGNICRKIARRVATDRPYPKRITPKIIHDYLGPPPILPSRVNREDDIGTVTGLVWTSSGGDVQIVEVSLVPGKGNLTLTGQLGEVLQESAQTALSYVRRQARRFDVPHDDFENLDVHIHLPEGSVHKDGPSAGITLTVALLSAFTERPVRSDTALTGEVTLRGHVLPVGGVKEKLLAARRYRLHRVILPEDNRKDLSEMKKSVLDDFELLFVRTMDEVIDAMLRPAPEMRQRDLEAEEDAREQDDANDGTTTDEGS